MADRMKGCIDVLHNNADISGRAGRVPMQRMGDVGDVANAALFFASDEAKYVTGVVMAVDGGITCSLPH